MQRLLMVSYVVAFDDAAEELTAYGTGRIVGGTGDTLADALLGEVSTAITANPVIDGCYARLLIHSHSVVDAIDSDHLFTPNQKDPQ